MKKSSQVGVRWNPAIKGQWEKFARETFNKDSSTLAREVLEEFMACFSPDDDLLKLGLANLTGARPGGLLNQAIKNAKKEPVAAVEEKIKRGRKVG